MGDAAESRLDRNSAKLRSYVVLMEIPEVIIKIPDGSHHSDAFLIKELIIIIQ